ncbi:hypothetical protein [Cellulomonas phragmiteti]|nr:hypothetical protein [Cellulomonas phragmiteti]
MADDARGGMRADAMQVQGAAAVGPGEGSAADRGLPAGELATSLLNRGWVVGGCEEWQWRVGGTVHARVLTSCDGACLVLGEMLPGDWTGHLDTATLVARLDDVERHRAGRPLPGWAVTDSLLADVAFVARRTRSWWHAWTVVRGADHALTVTTTTGPLAARHPAITFTPRPAREVARSPQTVRLHLDGHPERTFWARRLLTLANTVQGHHDLTTELCDVTDDVDAAWEVHGVLDPRGGWCFTGSCHGGWRRGHPLHPLVTVTLTRTPGEVQVELCGAEPGVMTSSCRVPVEELATRLDEIEAHRPGRSAPVWPRTTVPTWQCLLT